MYFQTIAYLQYAPATQYSCSTRHKTSYPHDVNPPTALTINQSQTIAVYLYSYLIFLHLTKNDNKFDLRQIVLYTLQTQ